jgi:Family of unknown function (DUF6527)
VTERQPDPVNTEGTEAEGPGIAPGQELVTLADRVQTLRKSDEQAGRPVLWEASPTVFVFHCPGCGYGHHIDTTRWRFNGDMVRPTVNPSVLVNASGLSAVPRCHSFILDGQIQYLSDCTHELAGQTVPLPADDAGGEG